MIFLATQSAEEDREERRLRGRYTSKKDLFWILVVVTVTVVVAASMIKAQGPNRDKTICRRNLKHIADALLSYSVQESDVLPPAYYMDSDGGPVIQAETGAPVTWMSLIEPHLNSRADFVCPSAKPEERSPNFSFQKGVGTFPGTYGMYRGLSCVPINRIPNSGSSVLVAETAESGANGSYDPEPFAKDRPDGFLIGWDNGNLDFDLSTKSVTRLAFGNSASGYREGSSTTRHPEEIFGITVEKGLVSLTPAGAAVQQDAPRLKGRWWADPNLYKP
ncbi:MAG: hypothetical protein JST30_09365 [Armatimonadetes bacterium]|nr:hypothetical protein [Armatimonadota bacterium]